MPKNKVADVNEVFTPSSPAELTFVDRDTKLTNRLVNALNTRGRQVIVYGHSGSGKTTLVKQYLNRTYEHEIYTRCLRGMTYDQILRDAFDQAEPFYTDTKSKKKSSLTGVDLSSSYQALKLGISKSLAEETSTSEKRIAPPDLTPQRLAEFIGEIGACWVLEDFHKIDEPEKVKVAQLMKLFMDIAGANGPKGYKSLKIMAIGAVGSGRKVIKYDAEMRNRISEIEVKLMTDDDLRKIIDKGSKLLNVRFEEDVINRILVLSNGLGSVCHQLCLNICYEREIHQTSEYLVKFSKFDLENGIEQYLEDQADSLLAMYDKAIRISGKKRKVSSKAIMRSVILHQKYIIPIGTLWEEFHKKHPTLKEDDVRKVAMDMCSPEHEEVLRYDEDSDGVYFSDQFFRAYVHCKIDAEEKHNKDARRAQLKLDLIIERVREIMSFDSDFEASDIQTEELDDLFPGMT